jgi:hypothetical protein
LCRCDCETGEIADDPNEEELQKMLHCNSPAR